MKQKNQAFTILELLFVVAAIGVIALLGLTLMHQHSKITKLNKITHRQASIHPQRIYVSSTDKAATYAANTKSTNGNSGNNSMNIACSTGYSPEIQYATKQIKCVKNN